MPSLIDRLVVSVFVAIALLLAAPAFAEEGGAVEEPRVVYDASSSDEGFVSAPASEAETVNGGTLMLIAYALLWLMVLFYVFVLARRARAAQGELDELAIEMRELDERLDELEAGEAG